LAIVFLLASYWILDALVVLWSAKRIANNQASYIPKIPEKPNMQIVY
jgi:predicted RNase H-like nuclease